MKVVFERIPIGCRMKLPCEVEISDHHSLSFSLPKRRACYSTLVVYQDTKAIGPSSAKSSNVYLIICTARNPAGTKYKIQDNIEKIFKSYLNLGKATIRFIEPPHDILIKKADPFQLKTFIQFINLALENNKTLKFSQPPTKLEKLPQEVLSVNGNGNYPKTFSSSLKNVTLVNCKLKIIDPRILKLSNLNILDLQSNKIIELPSELTSLCLRSLNLSDNKIERFPKEICSGNLMKFLQNLNLNGNLISTLPPEFCHFKQLNTLKISSNKLNRLPENIGKLRNLKVFMARNNCLKYLPLSILTLHLEVLDITDNSFRSKADLSLPKFEVLSLLDCAFISIKKHNVPYGQGIVPTILLPYLDKDYGECICGRIVVSKLSSTIIFSNVGISSVVTYSHRLNHTVPVKIHYCSLNCWKRQIRGYATCV